MRTCTLSKALSGSNSLSDYAHMASGENVTKSYSFTHLPYHAGDKDLMKEYRELLKKKGVIR